MKTKILILSLIFLLGFLLRVYKLGAIPSGFYSDESLYGYEAYSILQTGKDQYGNFLPLVFKAFGDYRPGLFIYTLVPFIKLFGLTEFATRLPAALFSLFTCVAIFLLSFELWRKFWAATLASFLFAISPWSLQFARMSHEANIATFLVVLASYLFIKGSKRHLFLILSLILFSLSLYSYYNTRVFVPLWLVTLIIFFRKNLFNQKKYLGLGLIITAILVLPLFKILNSAETGWSRVDAVSLWGDPGIVAKINEFRGEDSMAKNSLSPVFHNKIVDGSIAFLKSFSTHFDPQFLFFQGDPVQLYQTPNTGLLFFAEPLILLIAVFVLWKKKDIFLPLFLFWFIFGLLPDTLTRLSPAAPRIHLVLPLLSLMGGYGLYHVIINKPRRNLTISFIAILSGFTIFQLVYLLHQNFIHTPIRYARQWHYGLKQLVAEIKTREDQYQQIWISKNGWGWINYLFYLTYPPEKIQKEIKLSEKNEYGLGWVYGFGKYKFDDFPQDLSKFPDTLFIGTPADFSGLNKPLYIVYYPSDEPAFYIADKRSF